MTSSNRIEQLPMSNLRMSTTATIDAQTQKRGFGDRIHYGINQAAGVIGSAAGIAGSLVGAPVVSAAISQVGGLGGAPGSNATQSASFMGGGGIGSSLGGIGGGIGGGTTGAAFGTALQAGPPGLIQQSAMSASGPISGSLIGGTSSSLTSTYPSSTSTSSVGVGGVSADPFSAISGGSSSSAGGYQNYFSSLGQQQYQMLNLQIAMQQEYQFFATLSNVLKTRYDTAKNSISNIR